MVLVYHKKFLVPSVLGTFEEELEIMGEGEIIDWDPKVGDYGPNGHKWKQHNINRHDWSAEEIYKYGYLPLTERKEEYERQEASKKGWAQPPAGIRVVPAVEMLV